MQRVQPALSQRAYRCIRGHGRPLTIIGSFVSPYVRKVLACSTSRASPIEIDPITPFYGNDEFARLSPLRRIPVLIDGDFSRQRFVGDLRLSRRSLSRPSVVPGRPEGPRPRALAGGIADTRLGDVFIWGCSTRRSSARWCGASRPTRRGSQGARARTSPRRSIISKASCRRTASCSARSASPTLRSPASSATPPMPGSRSTPARWPRTAAFVAAHARPSVHRRLLPFEDVQRSADDQGPAAGAARRRRAADRRDARPARAAHGA